ncbi:hypothetical protein, variant [Aphanomyces astaci]|uniref:Anaphase-promoting complex subunit 4-like WD40 domain-containing protein n=1 Tax=Aphanomyces astaci TaxID=112090 RepID=W4G714_APHAT|nr:hypothetical protein, variant [Aphanomyces astaci]ETV75502.1 hypothetical protein, variant [Aphanomyces astaci]|eukprot:XP_009835136.1 hypothetical protein, variant [Aphanomyces astaci]
MGNQAGSPRKKKAEHGGNFEGGGSEDACSSKLVRGMFDLHLIGHHGLPSQPSRICYVPMLGLLVVATGYQQLKVYGEDGLEVYLPLREDKGDGTSSFSAGATPTFLDYTNSGKLVLVMSDSAVQVIDLANLQEGKDVVVAALPSSWTTSRITALETIRHHKDTPFFYVALDDGSVQVVQESTCHFASYAIYPDDVGLAPSADSCFVSAMASSPADPNHLLLAYEGSDVVYVWDLVKQRVAFQTSHILNQTQPASTVQSLAWHASGKRFAVGFASGSVAVCRSDKHQLAVYPTLVSSTTSSPTSSTGGIQRLHWLTTHASSPGALVCSVGSHVVVWFPPRDAQKGPKEALTELSSSSCFPWQTCVLPSHNHANVMDMAVASTVVPASGSSAAPFTAIVLAGNPLDGIKPSVAMHVLPCLVAHAHTPNELWQWIVPPSPTTSTTSTASSFPVSTTTHQLQASDVVAMQVLDLHTADAGAFRDELFAAQPILLEESNDMDDHTRVENPPLHDERSTTAMAAAWVPPLTGGSVTVSHPPPLPSTMLPAADCKRLLSITSMDDNDDNDIINGEDSSIYLHRHTKRTTWVVTAHADSRVKIWESHPPVDGASRGQMGLLHVLRVKPVLQDPISYVWFGPSRRLLVVGTSTGEVGFFTFDSDSGFSFVFSLHVHSGAITLLAVPKSDYPDDGQLDVAVADAFGVVCIVHVASQTYKLVIFDLALDTDDDEETGGPVESLVMDRSLLFVGRGDGHVQVYDVATAALVLTCRGATTGDGNGDHVTKMLLMDQGGRERGPVEVLSAVQMASQPKCRAGDERGDGGKDDEAAAAADVVVVDTVTQALVDDLLGKFPSPPPTTNSHKHVTVCVEAGPLGIFLVDDVTDRAVLRGFVPDDPNAQLQQAAGIVPGSTLVRVNGVDVRRLNKADVVAVVSSLSGVAKTVSYAPDHTSTDAHARPYIVCAVGRSIKVFAVPTDRWSHESQPKPDNSVVQVDVEADVGLRAPVVSMAISAIPVEGRMEQALVVVDQSGVVYVLALPTLHFIWSAPCPSDFSAGYAFDHAHVHVNASGSVLLGTPFGDLAEYSILAPSMWAEVNVLQWVRPNDLYIHITRHIFYFKYLL